jgi:DNA modification methylase
MNKDLFDKIIKPKDVLTAEEIKKLPKWVKDDLENAKIVGKSQKVIEVSNGKKFHLNNSLNDLNGAEWSYFLRSVFATRYSTKGEDSYAHHIRKIHPSPKPPQLMEDLIRFFSKENQWVLDYFAGVGGTLLGASLSNRNAIGIDLDKKYMQAYKDANKYLGLKEQKFLIGDSLKLLSDKTEIKKILGRKKFHLIAIDPPYSDMLSRKKTGEAVKKNKSVEATPFTDLKEDLGNMEYEEFLSSMNQSIIDATSLLENKGHILVFTKDLQPTPEKPNLLHSDLINKIIEIPNIEYRGMKIWSDESINLYPYGYPYAFSMNQLHQYILIFRKVNL